MRHNPLKRDHGFTLLEALVALAVLAAGLAAIGKLGFSSLAATQRAEGRLELTSALQSALAALPDRAASPNGRFAGQSNRFAMGAGRRALSAAAGRPGELGLVAAGPDGDGHERFWRTHRGLNHPPPPDARPMTPRSSERGFTLLEALAAVAVVGAILIAVGAISAQWLPQWRHGFERAQSADNIAQALDRIGADIAAAEYARLDAAAVGPLFRGAADGVAFVRSASGPNASPRLEVVRVGAVPTADGAVTQRAHATFEPGAVGSFRDGVTFLRPPFRLALAYAGPDAQWRSSWSGGKTLPRAVRLTVFGARGLPVASDVVLVKITAPPKLKAPSSPDAQANSPSQ